MVNAPALRLGLFLCPLRFDRNRGYTNMPPASTVAVFTHGKRLSANLVPVAFHPCRRLMLLCEGPALALLPVPPLQRLPAGRLYLIPHLAVLGDYVVIHGLSMLIDAFHILSPLSIRTWLCCRKYPRAADSSLHTLPLLSLRVHRDYV